MGLPIRPATGLLLTTPYAVTHHWLEFAVADKWLSADPFLLSNFARWGILDPAEWPPNRSPQPVLWRLGNDQIALATHGNFPITPRFTVRQSVHTTGTAAVES